MKTLSTHYLPVDNGINRKFRSPVSGFTNITSRVGLPVICNLRPEHCKLRPVAELAQENRRERDREARAPTAPAVL